MRNPVNSLTEVRRGQRPTGRTVPKDNSTAISARLPTDLYREVKMEVFRQGTTIQDVAVQLFTRFVAEGRR